MLNFSMLLTLCLLSLLRVRVSAITVYGHVHMAKTAGTTINGNFSMYFERICGHKGYSYDAIQCNHRVTNRHLQRNDNMRDDLSVSHPGYSRIRVPLAVMNAIGYENCDWISFEESFQVWHQFKRMRFFELELHVPCRDPIDHLLSQCNHRSHVFNCSHDSYQEEVKKCLLDMSRYSNELQSDFAVKCFDFSQVELGGYFEYMRERLQKRRITMPYAFRATNRPRHALTSECLYQDKQIQRKVINFLIHNYDYYGFCSQCLGSENDLFFTTSSDERKQASGNASLFR